MKKLLAVLVAGVFSLSALAQSYPSPTFNSLVIQNPLTPANGGTGATSSTGTGSVVLSNSPALTTPNLGTPSAITLTNATGLPASGLATQAANTVVANVTGSTASPTAFAMPSCSGTNSSLKYTSGTGFGCNATTATLGANTFTGNQTISLSGVALLGINDTSGTNQARITLENQGAQAWGLVNQSSNNLFNLNRYVAGTLTDSPISVSNSTGAVTMTDGITNSPISGSTGSFTTLAASGTTGLGTPTTIGTSVYPTIVQPVNTTATTTNGSANITVTSATGIAVGMGVYGTFVSSCSNNETVFSQAYVTAIAGTTVTMSCQATATNSTAVAVQFGQQRYSTTSSIIASDVGAETLKVGSAAQGNTASWLNQISTGQDYRLTSAAQIVTPPGGGYALTVASRTSDATGGAVAFPFQALFYADTGNPANSEAAYFQSNLNAATAGHTPHIQFEQTIESAWGTPPDEDPYTTNAVNMTIAHRLDCGSGGSLSDSDCSTAIDIVPNNQAFKNGIVFVNGSLSSSGGKNAMSLPIGYGITWFSAASTYSGFIESNAAGSILEGVPAGGQYNFQVNGTTIAQITNTGLNGTAIGATTPSTAAFTTVAASGLISPTSSIGIKGTTAADNAQAGSDGEYASAPFSSTAIATSGTAQNLASLNLTAGDWDVSGYITYTSGTGATTTIWIAGINTTPATLPAVGSYFQSGGSITATGAATASAPVTRENVSATTTVYLVGDAVFSGGSVTASGFLRARRVR